ncbi:MAG: hypothetical protein J3T61_06260 [Candidatus Brocadiales bacterium]|nr:hypothetical protein [Candidatus Bathyanammoxibius sp.]
MNKFRDKTKAVINGIECILFYDERVSAEEAPAGYPYMYYVRHDEDNWVRPISIEKYVLVNFFGTIFTKELIDFDNNYYVDVESFEMSRKYIEFKLSRERINKMLGLD